MELSMVLLLVYLVLVYRVSLCHGLASISSSSSSSATSKAAAAAAAAAGSRHVCMFQDYATVRGPYFFALMDQLVEQNQLVGAASSPESSAIKKRLAYFCTRDGTNSKTSSTTIQQQQSQLLETDLQLDSCHILFLDDYNPLELQAQLDQIKPTVLWVADAPNAFLLRYLMRTSGLDGIVQEMCGSTAAAYTAYSADAVSTTTTTTTTTTMTKDDDDNQKEGDRFHNLLYVGEGAGAICGGATMATAHLRGDNPKGAPEPQFRGLELLGPDQNIFFGSSRTSSPDESTTTMPENKSADNTAQTLDLDRVFVWSQPPTSIEGDVTSFVFNPSQKGTVEQFSSPPRVPPLVDNGGGDDEYSSMGGRKCTGEPAVDPSRMLEQIGDSEWCD
jgi:hypothetical protein